ncbi:MAG: formylmethanofuran dehydrogenase [Candidatus Omnitrophota bacterium]|nr:MAG: formylmethanofuran dehydrogenase [Candidatus Omnitrophota bacterium]RKY39289.1 MAG: formylmethanofuran dehydrogenase [Candidatus Omnitrophota bacterium]
MISKDFLEMAIKFHGHKCPAMPLGLRAGLAAMKKLGVERASNKELYCLCETGFAHATMCFVDGVQVATGCTFGKSNIEKLDYEKNAITLIDVKKKKAVRVVLNPEFQKKGLASKFVQMRKEGIEPKDIDPEVVDPMIENIMKQPDEVLFKFSEVFDYDFKGKKGTFEWYECENCGEVVFAHGVRIKDDKKVCIPCSRK